MVLRLGKREGLSNAVKSRVHSAYLAYIKGVEPEIFIHENVPGFPGSLLTDAFPQYGLEASPLLDTWSLLELSQKVIKQG
jgi:hypothetical protein